MLPPLGARDLRALLVFFGGVLILFVFFAAGAYVGRWPHSRGTTLPAATGQRSDSELYLVEVAAFDTADKADEVVQKRYKQYTSIRRVFEPTDRLHHVYVGPYPLDQANALAEDLRQHGAPSAVVKPYARP